MPPQIINLSGISAGDSGQTVTITATSSNTAVIPNPAVGYASPGSTGTLTFTPVANANGNVTITIVVTDNGAGSKTFTRTLNVAIAPVNDPPTLSTVADVTINEDAAAQSLPLSGIAGPANESGQPLTVTAFSNNPSLLPYAAVVYPARQHRHRDFQPAPMPMGRLPSASSLTMAKMRTTRLRAASMSRSMPSTTRRR